MIQSLFGDFLRNIGVFLIKKCILLISA
jgi:hypothetical protein